MTFPISALQVASRVCDTPKQMCDTPKQTFKRKRCESNPSENQSPNPNKRRCRVVTEKANSTARNQIAEIKKQLSAARYCQKLEQRVASSSEGVISEKIKKEIDRVQKYTYLSPHASCDCGNHLLKEKTRPEGKNEFTDRLVTPSGFGYSRIQEESFDSHDIEDFPVFYDKSAFTLSCKGSTFKAQCQFLADPINVGGIKAFHHFRRQDVFKKIKKLISGFTELGYSLDVAIFNALKIVFAKIDQSICSSSQSTGTFSLVLALEVDNALWVANVGDTSACVYSPSHKGGVITPLASMQVAECTHFHKGIVKRGGRLIRDQDGVSANLPVARALGGYLNGRKDLGLSARPKITRYLVGSFAKKSVVVLANRWFSEAVSKRALQKALATLSEETSYDWGHVARRLAIGASHLIKGLQYDISTFVFPLSANQ